MVIEFIAPIGAAILAGVAWSTLGIWNRWRGNQDAEIDWSKVKKNVIIGSGLGVATFGYGIVTGEVDVVIDTGKAFILAVAVYFPLIVVVDKILNKKEEETEE